MDLLTEELNDIFFNDYDIIQEMKLMDKNVVKKIKDKLEATIKSKDPKRLDKLLKPVPSMSFDGIKSLLKKRVIKDKQQFEKNYKIAQRKIVRVKNENAKKGLSLAAATAATAAGKDVEDLIDENQRVFDPKNLVMLLLGLYFLAKFIMVQANPSIAFVNPTIAYIIAGIAVLMIIKTSYNLIAGKEAKSLFLIL